MTGSSVVRGTIFVTLVVAAVGCQTAANSIPGFKWAARSTPGAAESVAGTAPSPQPTGTSISGPPTTNLAADKAGANESFPQEDPLKGFYAEDLPASAHTTGGFISSGISASGGGSRAGAGGCNSGCCH